MQASGATRHVYTDARPKSLERSNPRRRCEVPHTPALAAPARTGILSAPTMPAVPQTSRLDDVAVHDTVEAVFRDPAYARGVLRTPEWLRRVGRWLVDLLGDVRVPFDASPVLFWGAVALLVTLAALVVARAIWAARQRRLVLAGEGPRRARGSGLPRDQWLAAQALAARGDFTEAAHALYRALLATLARRGQVKLHPSKTVGDYVRELRARSSVLFARFRDFARSYEVVVYGVGWCDEERWKRLHALAEPIVARDA